MRTLDGEALPMWRAFQALLVDGVRAWHQLEKSISRAERVTPIDGE